MILLDTQIVIWLIGNDRRLGKNARKIIIVDNERRVSAMVAWEIAMSVDKGRLTLGIPLDLWIETSLASIEASDVTVSRPIARDAGSLPGDIHGDPCDRLMIATARWLGCPLLTSDRKILHYARAGHVKAIDARR